MNKEYLYLSDKEILVTDEKGHATKRNVESTDMHDVLLLENDLERIDTKDYPEYALRESLLNAIIHRDYNFTGSILISLFDDHFEITSLGGLVKGLSIEDLYNGVSESRNPNLANIFYRLKYVESFGTGIGRIIESYKEYDKEPLILNSENVFKVTLYNVNYVKDENIKILPTNLTQEEQIIEYLKKNNKPSIEVP